MLKGSSFAFMAYFFRAYPRRSMLMVLYLGLAGLAEGVGIVTLLPLLQIGLGGQSQATGIGRVVVGGLGLLGLPPTVGVLLCTITVGIALKGALSLLAMVQVGFTIADVTTDLRLQLIRSLLRARWGFLTNEAGGFFTNAIASESLRATEAYLNACHMIAGMTQVLVYTALAFLVSWPVALSALVAGGLVVWALRGLVDMGRGSGEAQTDLTRALMARLTDALQGIKPLKAMAQEERLVPLLEGDIQGLNRSMKRKAIATESFVAMQEPLIVALLAAGLYVMINVGHEAFADVLLLAFLFNRLMVYINNAQQRYLQVAASESAFHSMHAVIGRAVAAEEPRRSRRPVPDLRRGISLRGVGLAHEGRQILADVNLEIPVGTFVALNGVSGAGKTTLADAIIGFHTPVAGEILLDGVPLSDVDLRAWRKCIGYVPQEMLAFHDTIYRNITLGDEGVGRDEVMEALAAAGAAEFVQQMPAGLDTVIGEHGSKLSGGQRQRIAIARALVRHPKLLILDEVTSALDPVTEAEICGTLRQLHGRVTILSISHQTAMVEAADVVYEVRHGTVSRAREVVEEPSSAA